MLKFVTPGVVAGALVLAGGIAGAAGYPIAAAFLQDPSTAEAATMVLTGAGALLAGILAGVRKAA